MKLRTVAAALALTAACALPAIAQESSPAAASAARQAPSPARVAAAERLLEVMRVREMTTKGLEPMIRAMLDQSPEMREIEDIFRDYMAEMMDWEMLGPEFARIYAEIYTEEEMEAMTAFYATPIGQRVIDKMPEVMSRSATLSNERVRASLPTLMQRIMERAMEAEKRETPKEGKT